MAYQFTQTGAEIQDILDLAQLQIAAPYDSASSYTAGDYCTKDDGFYCANASTTGTWNSSKWDAVTVGDVLSSLNATLTQTSTRVDSLDANAAIVKYAGWAQSFSFPLRAGGLLLINGGGTAISFWWPASTFTPVSLWGDATTAYTWSYTNNTVTVTASGYKTWQFIGR